MPLDLQKDFFTEYRRRRRGLGLPLALAIFFPVQLFFLGRWLLGLLFWVSLGGLGVWWVVEIFLTPSRVRAYNMAIAYAILGDIIGMVI
jgi:hypothetical protein